MILKIIKNSRKKRFLGLLLLAYFIATPPILEAMKMNEQSVRSAVENWVRNITADARPDAVIDEMESYIVNGEAVAYIAHLNDGGFCLCGADNLVLPVYLYCPKDFYNPKNPDYRFVLNEISYRTEYLTIGLRENNAKVEVYRDFLSRRALYWEDLIAGHIPVKKSKAITAAPDSMSLNLNTLWHQDSIYNALCPELDPSEHVAVGCVATAMSQILYYWKWPNTGTGTGNTTYYWRRRTTWDTEVLATNPNLPIDWAGRLEWTPAGAGTLRMTGRWDYSLYSEAWYENLGVAYHNALTTLYNRLTNDSTVCNANFGATTYQWSLIGDNHIPPPDAGDTAVARLCYHSGIAVEMDYGVWFSGASSDSVETALQNHFSYDNDAVYFSRDVDTMTNEIQWLRPVYFRGRTVSDDAGHAWIVIGYNRATDPNRQFLMNMGWGGGTAWYTCDSIPDDYNFFQKHTIMIAPEDVVEFVGNIDNGDGSPDNPYLDIEEAYSESDAGATLIFKAGSNNTFESDSIVLDKRLTLKGRNATIQ